MEDQKELPSPVNPELRQKEVQMNFFNQLTSVFNPDITMLASPLAHMQVSELDESFDWVQDDVTTAGFTAVLLWANKDVFWTKP